MNFKIDEEVIKSHEFFKPEENYQINHKKTRSKSISQEEIKRSGTKPPQRDNTSRQSHIKDQNKGSRKNSQHKHLMVSEEYNHGQFNGIRKDIGRFV